VGCLDIKRPGRETDNSSSCSVEVTDAWRCSYGLLKILVVWLSDEHGGGGVSFLRYFALFLRCCQIKEGEMGESDEGAGCRRV